jgi:hypothetical protein
LLKTAPLLLVKNPFFLISKTVFVSFWFLRLLFIVKLLLLLFVVVVVVLKVKNEKILFFEVAVISIMLPFFIFIFINFLFFINFYFY